MYTYRIHGHLTTFKGRLKEQWGRLTHDRLAQVDGAWDQLNGLLQREYGMAKHEVDAQLVRLRHKYEGRPSQAAAN